MLPMSEAIRLLDEAFAELREGRAQSQPRRRLIMPSGTVLHSMAGSAGKYFGTKIYSTNRKYGMWFLFLLYDAETGRALGMFEANYLGQIRTGAASGLATDRLARPDARILGIIGSGFQARSELEAMLAVRPISEVRIWSRTRANCEAFAAACGHLVLVTIADTAMGAVQGCDIVVTATTSKDPVLEDEWVGPGAHINAMGSNVATRRELPAGLVRRADYVVADSVEQARIEAGDLLLNLDVEGWKRVGELKENRRRQNPAEITIFKSIGIGLEDVAVGGYLYERALRENRGRELEMFIPER